MPDTIRKENLTCQRLARDRCSIFERIHVTDRHPGRALGPAPRCRRRRDVDDRALADAMHRALVPTSATPLDAEASGGRSRKDDPDLGEWR
jgi:hypothetical protein